MSRLDKAMLPVTFAMTLALGICMRADQNRPEIREDQAAQQCVGGQARHPSEHMWLKPMQSFALGLLQLQCFMP